MEALKQCYYKIEDFITAVCKVVGGLSVFIFVMVIFLQVVLRNAFKMPIIWANDVAVISFVWATFFGSACAVRKRSHYTVELIPAKFAKTNKILDLIGDISGFIFFSDQLRAAIFAGRSPSGPDDVLPAAIRTDNRFVFLFLRSFVKSCQHDTFVRHIKADIL